MKFNKDKCEVIAMNGYADIHFSDGVRLKTVNKATYLGGVISNNAGRQNDINNRLSKALATCGKLKEFF